MSRPVAGNRFHRRGHRLLLGLVLLGAAALRLFNLDWDGGHLYHPDERHILMVTDRLAWPPDLALLLTPESPLNPKSFAYGSLVFYLLRAVTSLLGTLGDLGGPLAGLRDLDSLLGMRLVGRTLSALFDTGTVLVVYLLGRTLYDRWAGLLAAALVGLATLHIQLAHFYASDTPLTFFLTTTLLHWALFLRTGRRRWALLAGLTTGLALATKVSAAPVLLLMAVGPALRVARASARQPWPWERLLSGPALRAAVTTGLPSLAVAALTFALCSPYALIDATTFVQHVAEQNAMARGLLDLPYTRQYINRPHYLYFLQNLGLFGFGPALGLAALGGSLFALLRGLWRRRTEDLLLLAWVVPYFAIVGSFHAKFLRYLLPITPVLCLFAAVGLLTLRRWLDQRRELAWLAAAGSSPHWLAGVDLDAAARRWFERKGLGYFEHVPLAAVRPDHPLAAETGRRRAWPGRLVAAGIGLVVLGTAFWALAYVRVYTEPHTADRASAWIYQHIPAGAVLATEHWEEGLPVPLRLDDRLYTPEQYRRLTLNLYEPDDERKYRHLVETLQQADYILFFSNRLYGTIPRLPDRYPLTTRYYQLLFGEQLGFELVAVFATYPNLFGLALVDDTLSDPGLPTPRLLRDFRPAPLVLNLGRADESFSVYDHPKVLIFRKRTTLSEADLRLLLGGAWAVVAPESGPRYKSLLLSPDQQARIRAGGTYRDLFDPDSLANRVPLLVWVAGLVVFGLIGWPLAFGLFPALADRGFALRYGLAILLVAWLNWLLVSLTPLPASRAVAGLMLLVAAGLAGGLAWRQWPALRAFWGERWLFLLAGEAVFWGAFFLFLGIRLLNPDLWHPARGGEKPMDLAYLMAAIKSVTYPPYDPWFAGGYLNYYYFGQIVVGTLIKLSGIVPTTAYNLVIPLLFAMTAAGAFSAGLNLALSLGRPARGAPPIAGGSTAAAPVTTGPPLTLADPAVRQAFLAGGLATLFVCLIGNLGGAGQLLDAVAQLGGFSAGSPLSLGFLLAVGLGLARLLAGQTLVIPTDWYWPSTRVIAGTINEFPFFTFLYADLHAHLIALPFTLLALGVALDRVLRPVEGAGGGTRRALVCQALGALPRLLAGALVIGALFPMNSWDFPTYFGLVGLALLVGWLGLPDRRVGALLRAGVFLAGLGALSYLLYLPFHRAYQAFYTGFQPIPDASPLGDYLVIHGPFLAVLLSFLLLAPLPDGRFPAVVRVCTLWGRHWDRPDHLLALWRRLSPAAGETLQALLAGALGLAGLAGTLAVLGKPLAGLLLALGLVVAGLFFHPQQTPARRFLLGMVGTGLALGVLTELVALEGDIGRMNTVFKFYLQVWVLWGIAAAVALPTVVARLRALPLGGLRRLWLGGLAVLLVATLVYPVVGTAARVRDRFVPTLPPTLDGTAYMQVAVHTEGPEGRPGRAFRLASDLQAIRWLQANVEGTPVIAEAVTPLYRWGSRYAIYTGLPIIIGWDWHQKQQRWGYQYLVDERIRDVQRLYNDPAPEVAWRILLRYGVDYLIVGELERIYYSPQGLAKFDRMVGPYLDIVYDQDGVKIYRVRRSGG